MRCRTRRTSRSAVWSTYARHHDAERRARVPADASRLYAAFSCVHPPWWVHELLAETVAYNLLLEAHVTPDACDAAETGAAAVALPAPMFIGEAHCSSYLTYRSAREVGGGGGGGRAFGGAQNKRARDTAKKATAAAGKRGGGAASAAARDFVPAEVDAGWWFGEDVADKPGWIVDAPGTQHISFPVSASRGIVKLAYLRTDLATMGKAHVWVSAAPGGTLTEAGAALAKAPLELDGKWDDRFSLTQVAELNNVGRGELRLHVRKVAGAKFKVEAVMSC